MRFFLFFTCFASYFLWDFVGNGGRMTVRAGTAIARMLY